jgi:hypothetical protein
VVVVVAAVGSTLALGPLVAFGFIALLDLGLEFCSSAIAIRNVASPLSPLAGGTRRGVG